MKPSTKQIDLRHLRHRSGLNQQEFWAMVGVTQSGGSRYETGRAMPKPVRELLRLVHIEGIDLAHVKGEYVVVAQKLRASKPALYQRLKQQVNGTPPRKAR